MIFPVLKTEKTLQVGDKTRLDAENSYVTTGEDALTVFEIEPEAGAGFIDITTSKHLDYQYSTDGNKVVTLRVDNGSGSVATNKTISVISEENDKLFSSDEEIVPHEPSILDYVRGGRSSFLDIHRTAQDRIVKWLDEHRIWGTDGTRLTKDAIVDIEEVNDWSKYMTLRMIFEGLSNAVDDIFSEKSNKYRELEKAARNRSSIRLDKDGDGEADSGAIDLRSVRIRRG